jgi:hypothetical protein
MAERYESARLELWLQVVVVEEVLLEAVVEVGVMYAAISSEAAAPEENSADSIIQAVLEATIKVLRVSMIEEATRPAMRIADMTIEARTVATTGAISRTHCLSVFGRSPNVRQSRLFSYHASLYAGLC